MNGRLDLLLEVGLGDASGEEVVFHQAWSYPQVVESIGTLVRVDDEVEGVVGVAAVDASSHHFQQTRVGEKHYLGLRYGLEVTVSMRIIFIFTKVLKFTWREKVLEVFFS